MFISWLIWQHVSFTDLQKPPMQNYIESEWWWWLFSNRCSRCLGLEKLWTWIMYMYFEMRARRALPLLNDVPLRTRRALSLFNNALLRTRRVLSLYKVYGDSALLVLNGTSLNSINALLVLRRYFHENCTVPVVAWELLRLGWWVWGFPCSSPQRQSSSRGSRPPQRSEG